MMGKLRHLPLTIITVIAGISLDLVLKVVDIFIVIIGVCLLGISYVLLKWSKSNTKEDVNARTQR